MPAFKLLLFAFKQVVLNHNDNHQIRQKHFGTFFKQRPNFNLLARQQFAVVAVTPISRKAVGKFGKNQSGAQNRGRPCYGVELEK